MLVPVISFNGCCADAIALYEKVFDVTGKHVEYYKDAPEGSGMDVNERTKNFVMHSGMVINGTYVNMSDDSSADYVMLHTIFNIMLKTPAEVERAYNMLVEDGGTVVVELGPQFFSPLYGSVKDRFGVQWQIITNE